MTGFVVHILNIKYIMIGCDFVVSCSILFSGQKNDLGWYLWLFLYFYTFACVAEKFMEHLVKYQDFVNNPGIIEDPNLVICINSKLACVIFIY